MIIDRKQIKILPTNDYIFKKLMGRNERKNITESFINKFVGVRNIEIEEVDENEILFSDLMDEKIGILDVVARGKEGEVIDIEIQIGNYEAISNRMLFYLSKLIINESINAGENYKDMKKIIEVFIVKDKIPELKHIEEYRTIWEIREEEYTQTVLTNRIQIVIIELGKIREILEKNPDKLNPKVIAWYKFLTSPEELDEKELEENEDVKKAKEEYDKIMSNEENWRIAFARELYDHDMASARGTGESEGYDKGKVQKALEIAKKLLKNGMNIEEIIEITELSREEIENLQIAN